MAEVKRLNYFTAQALVEQDFNDEQAYHLNSRRQHNRLLHAGGVAEGLDVALVSGKQVQVSAGMAIDNGGREIILGDALTYTLATPGTDRDVFLTIAYQEVLDPADKDTQGLNKVLRTTERPVLQDGTAVPPTDGPVVVLARIHLNHAGVIDSIDPSVRARTSARVTPASITSTRLADGAVALAKLADAVKPLSMRGADAIRVDTDTALRKVTIGDTHSGHTDNPHRITAAQINSQGSGNQLVSQINAGTGIINRANVESAIVSGVVTFENLAVGEEMFSNDIDPGFGSGAVYVQLALDNAGGPTSGGDTNYGRAVQLRSEVNRNTGRFRIFVTRNSGSPTGSVSVRWAAFEPIAGAVSTAAVGVVVSPSTANVHNTTQAFTANVTNTNVTGVTWSIAEGEGVNAGGTLSAHTGSSTTYTPPNLAGTYTVVATSTIDQTKQATVPVVVVVDVAVSLNQTTASVLLGGSLNFSASVINTNDKSVTWSVQESSGGGTVSPTTSTSATYAPAASGTFHVIAKSHADSSKTASCEITVPAVTIALDRSTPTVFRGEPLGLSATVGNAADTGVSWSIQEGTAGGSIAVTTGSSATYTAPLPPGTYHVIATSNADSNKKATCAITVPAVTIALNQTNVNVNRGATLGLTATVGNTSNAGVTWSVLESGGGSVSPPSGASTTYTPPNTAGTFHVIATSVADSSKTVQCQITVPEIGISLNPTTASVLLGGSLNLSAIVTNTNDTSVTWSVQETSGGGTVSPTTSTSATYTPAASGKFHVTAKSHADSSKTVSCEITVPAVTIALDKSTPIVFCGENLNLIATVGSAADTGVSWSIQEGTNGGSISATTGSSVRYTAPVPAGTYHVIATSHADSNQKATCTITVPAVTIALNQTTANVNRGATLGLTATVGNSNAGVTWSVLESGGGSVSPTSGASTTYTPPNTAGTFHVIAASAADSSKTVQCQITVPQIGISIVPDSTIVSPGGTTTVRAFITGTTDNRANWSVPPNLARVSPTVGPTTQFQASAGGTITVSANAVADTTKSTSTDIVVSNIDDPGGGGGPGGGSVA